MARPIFVLCSSLVTLCFVIQSGCSDDLSFVDSFFIDNTWCDTFVSEYIADKYIFKEDPIIFRGTRSIRDEDDIEATSNGWVPTTRNRKRFTNNRNKNENQIVIQREPMTVTKVSKSKNVPFRPYFTAGNHTYKLAYVAPIPRPVEILENKTNGSKPLRRSDVSPVYRPSLNSNYPPPPPPLPNPYSPESGYPHSYHSSSHELGPVYKHYYENITTYEKKKLPRLIPPFPFGVYTEDPVRPFPSGSVFTILLAFIVPFIPFGLWEFRMPVAWNINYMIERFNGYDNGELVTGRSFADDQADFFEWGENLLSNTLALDGKACIQRLICELSEVPVKQRSFMGEILHRIIEPRTDSNEMMNDYVAAEIQGKAYGECSTKYGKCPLTIRRLLPESYVNEVMRKRRK